MDEARWLSCEDPRKLVEWVRRKASDRKLRLFTCAFWRRWWNLAAEKSEDGEADEDVAGLVEYAEQWAERGERPTFRFPWPFGWHPLVARYAIDAANWTIRQTTGSMSRLDPRRYDEKAPERAAELQVGLLHDLLGNPFRPVSLSPSVLQGRDHSIVGFARAIYEHRAFDRLPALADALEAAGGECEEVLNHLRGNGPHVRGCWPVDQILGKS